ncbi:hypothetical protein Lgra_0560 [Legionella gratiana]|uniref:Uncharacterized protein n=1 Tax=Legionella gratiana TaxID=45066 RepID=A0A378J3G8_9GAMM|nr:hypothetical protein [Legionella gratiana]KTD14529.1 hypothetical protein Lgra_0560 [Legionella gratiana]STX41926.1 Uncharacterised protein [Legionella gratiana]
MKELFEKNAKKSHTSDDSTLSKHADVCTCTMCMKSKLSAEVVSEHLHALQSTMVDRRNPDVPGSKPLMKAAKAHAILKAGEEIDMLDATGINELDIPSSSGAIQITRPQELTIKATWKDKNQEHGVSGRDASVFGGLGVLTIPPDVPVMDIPKMNALAVPSAYLAKYGAELIPLEKSFTLDAVEDESLKNLYLVEYQWDADYIQDYVMNQRGGGGLFVETHPFPHVFTPLSPECGGALILGVKRDDGSFDFAAFEIPFGYTMKIGSNVIHGDSFFVGPYAIALTETELADSVLLKKDTPTRPIQQVTQKPTPTFTIPLFEENRLTTQVNHKMMVDKIRHEGVVGKDLSFFKQLPKEVLTEVRHLSEDSQEAYDQSFSLMPYSPKF